MMKLITLLTFLGFGLRAEEKVTPLKSDEQIVFYPSVAQRVPGQTNLWRAEVRGCVFEVEKWRLLIGAFRQAVELKSDDFTTEENTLFTNRARLFLVDNERRKGVRVQFGTNSFFVGTSGANGKFSGEITFTHAGALDFHAVLPAADARKFAGQVFPLEAEGLSVISDIDDTIKITEVRDKKATLRNTFLREFQPVPGMAEFYQTLARSPLTRPSATLSPSDGERDGVRGRSEHSNAQTNNIAFHYISASPWQLYEPLAAFVAANGFPAGTFELKQFRWKDRSFFSLFADPEKYKPGVIEPLLKQFPQRKFVLIGDSGERDPEIYGALARKFPEQVLHIYIRDVTNEAAESERYQEAFRAVPRAKWQIFREPTELPPSVKLPDQPR